MFRATTGNFLVNLMSSVSFEICRFSALITSLLVYTIFFFVTMVSIYITGSIFSELPGVIVTLCSFISLSACSDVILYPLPAK